MPELPEVETTKNLLEAHIKGKTIDYVTLKRPDLRFPFPKALQHEFNQATITHLSRHGKYMLWHFDNDLILIIHLGMTGRFIISDNQMSFPDFYHEYKIKPEHEHCIFHFNNGKRISYYDPRRFGFFDSVEIDKLYQNKYLKTLGPDGLQLNGYTETLFKTLQNKKKSAIKPLLLNQSIIAGVGNIYASEALWRSKVHPETKGYKLKKYHIDQVIQHIQDILHEAIQGGGSTLKDYRTPTGASGAYQNVFKVYDRTKEKCLSNRCKGIIEKITQAQRATFFCNTCQIRL